MNRHPSHNYVLYLHTFLPAADLSLINDNLSAVGMGDITAKYLKLIDIELADRPVGFQYASRSHDPSRLWVKSKRIEGMAYSSATVSMIRESILMDLSVRDFIERSLLAGVSAKDTSSNLLKIDKRVSTAVITSFAHYYWDVSSLNSGDWDVYFNKDSSRRTTTRYAEYSAAVYGGADAILLRAGVSGRLNSQSKLKIVEDNEFNAYMIVSSLPIDKTTVEMRTMLANSIVRVSGAIKSDDTKLTTALSKLEKFKVNLTESKIKKLRDIAKEGTTSLSPGKGD